MENKYLYLLLNAATISIPFLASFYPKAPFISSIKRIIPAIILPLIVFIVWDVFFTDMGVWGFNETYLTGINLINLPIEEWLFFVTVPYACLFTYFAVKVLKPIDGNWGWKLALIIAGGLLVIGIANVGKWYTSVTFISLALVLILLALKRKQYLGQFFFSYLFILIPFFLMNGVLTGSWIVDEVVWYNDAENLGIRLGTIPVEDAFYGMLLLLLNTVIWEELGQKPTSMNGAQ